MFCSGVIAEYNPFHNGHMHHLRETINIAGNPNVIAVMSGSFVQRGEPALFDKFTRTRMALKCGVSLVIELPCCFSAFIRRGVRIWSRKITKWFRYGKGPVLWK